MFGHRTSGGVAGRRGGRVGGVYYGWVMVLVATLATVATSPGQSFLVGSFSEAIRSDLGLSLNGLGVAYMVATFCASLPLTLVGRASDRYGTRAVMGVVALLLGGACWFIGGAGWAVRSLGLGERWEGYAGVAALTVSFFLLRFLGQGALGLVSSHVLAMWFERRLGFAESVRHLGMPLANAVLPGLVAGLIGWAGWGLAYGLLGVAVWLVVLPLVWLVYVNRPEDIGARVDGDEAARAHPEVRMSDPDEPLDVELLVPGNEGGADGEVAFTLGEAMRTRAYWTVVACLMANALAGTAFVFHRQPMMEDLGLGSGDASMVMVTFGLVSFVMTVPAGWVTDRVSLGLLLGIATGGLGLACVLYGVARGTGVELLMAHASFGVLGVSQSLMFVLASPIFARYFGRPHHGAIRGSLTTFMVVGTSVGPIATSWGRDVGGAFSLGYLVVGAVCVPLVVLGVLMRAPRGRGVRG